MADLLEIRTRLVNESGRFELVVDVEAGNYDDVSGNDVINDGVRWLNEIRKDIQNIKSNDSFVVLVLDTDTNYWSVNFESLLINTARRMLEARHRNSQGLADWEADVRTYLNNIYRNVNAEDIQSKIDADTGGKDSRTLVG